MEMKRITCKCQHTFQDKKYGSGVRLHNKMASTKANWRCSVCGDLKTDSAKKE